MNKNILIGILSILALITIAIGAWFFYFKTPAPVQYSVANTPTAVLATQNADYATAIAYEEAGKYDLALLSYQKALSVAKDQTQAAQIRIKMAIMAEWLGKYADAIAQLKAIAADTDNYPIARAYAVQEIGFMNVYTINEAHQTVLAETFKDAPYDSFKNNTNLNLVYTKLFEYAASIYPLGYSEAYVAYGYAGEIVNTLRRATTTPQAMAYISLIKQSLQAADADVQRMKVVPGEAVHLPETLVWQGVALSRLASVGAADSRQAEPYFKEGVDYGATLGNRPGDFNAFNYAAFLTYHYGKARSADIKTLLLPFRAGNESQIYSQIVSFYKNARTDTVLVNDKNQIIAMAKIDSDFKTYLISLGWEASDF